MPAVSKFFGEQHRLRWSSYLRQYVGPGKISPTALAGRIGNSVSRVSNMLKGERSVGEDLAWDIGHALRDLGADTNEIEALWAGGFFAAIFRLLQQVASEPNNGVTLAVGLYSLLPARMLTLETSLCKNVADVEHGAQFLQAYRRLAEGEEPVTEPHSTTITIRLPENHSNSPHYQFFRAAAHSPSRRRAFVLAIKTYAPEHFDLYQRAWELVCRGDRPKGPARVNQHFRGDDDLIDVLFDAAVRMKERWVPSLLIVRLWRIAFEWVDELEPVERAPGHNPFFATFDVIPDLFLATATVNARENLILVEDDF
jgi:hypothetical protein